MRQTIRLFAFAAALVLPCTGVQALDLAKINQAADAFVVLAKNSSTTGTPPRLSDPAAKQLLETVFDTSEIERGKPVPWAEIKILSGWNKAATKVGLIYYLAGTGVADVAALKDNPKALERANRNVVAFAPEFGRYSDMQIRLHAAMIDAAQTRLATAPGDAKTAEFTAIAREISADTAEALVGLLGTFVVEGVTDDWLLSRLVVLLDITPKAAKFLTKPDRERVQYAAAEVAEQLKNPDLKSGLNAMARAFALF